MRGAKNGNDNEERVRSRGKQCGETKKNKKRKRDGRARSRGEPEDFSAVAILIDNVELAPWVAFERQRNGTVHYREVIGAIICI